MPSNTCAAGTVAPSFTSGLSSRKPDDAVPAGAAPSDNATCARNHAAISIIEVSSIRVASDDLDAAVVQAVDVSFHDVARHDRADVLRRAAVHDVAREELVERRQVRDLLGDAPDHARQ